MPLVAADIAKQFREMADTIERNAEGSFGGAYVIVPPEGGGEAIKTLILDAHQDMALFWNSVVTKSQIMLTVAEKDQRAQGSFGQRR